MSDTDAADPPPVPPPGPPPPPDGPRRAWLCTGVLGVTLLALALRWAGIDHLLPHHDEPDAHLVKQVGQLRQGKDDVLPNYPLLVASLAAALPAGDAAPVPRYARLDEHLERAARPFLAVRTLVACLAVLIVPATFLLARRLLPAGWSLVAAVIVASDLLHLSLSTQARPHAVLATLTTLSVVASCRLARSGGAAWDLVAAGGLAGLSVACLHSGALALFPLAAASVFVLRAQGVRALPRLLVPAALALGLAAWSYAPTFDHGGPPPAGADAAGAADRAPEEPVAPPSDAASPERKDAPWTIRIPGHTVYLGAFNGRGFLVLADALVGHSPFTLVLIGAGLLAATFSAARRRRRAPRPTARTDPRDRWVLAAFVVPAVLVPGLYEMSNERFFLPLAPFLAVAAAAGVRAVARPAGGGRRLAVAAALAVLATAPPLATAARLALLRSTPDTASTAARWLDARTSPGDDTLVVGLESLPLLQRPRSLDRTDAWSRSAWERYQYTTPNLRAVARTDGRKLRYPDLDRRRLIGARTGWGLAWIEKTLAARPDVVVCAMANEGEWTRRVRFLLDAAGGRLRTRIAPGRSGAHAIDSPYWFGRSAALDVWRVDALGPPIEIWALER